MNVFGAKKGNGHMENRRLIAFGDSFTYGYHLPDHNTQSYPAILSSMLGLELINKADTGASNTEILTEILTFEFKETDLVVVGWTFIERDLIFRKNSFVNKLFNRHEHTRVQAGYDNIETKLWIRLHPEYDQAVRSGLLMHHAELYLGSLRLEQYHIFTQPTDIFRRYKSFPIFLIEMKHLLDKDIFSRVDLALDKSHPGIVSHWNTANSLYKIIDETR